MIIDRHGGRNSRSTCPDIAVLQRKATEMEIGKYLSDHGVQFETHDHAPAYTAQEVAAIEHVSGKMMAKAVLVRDDAGYLMCVLPASHKLDLTKVADLRKSNQIRLADENELAEMFPDAEVGAEPPFGNLYDMPMLVDSHLADRDEIVFQAGSHRQTIRMAYDDYASLVCPQVADLAVAL